MRVSRDKLPGDALALSLQKVWEVIRDQKDLNLPAHKVLLFSSLLGHLAPTTPSGMIHLTMASGYLHAGCMLCACLCICPCDKQLQSSIVEHAFERTSVADFECMVVMAD